MELIREIEDVRELGQCEVNDKVMFDGKLYFIEEVHKTNSHTSVILEDTEHMYRQVDFER